MYINKLSQIGTSLLVAALVCSACLTGCSTGTSSGGSKPAASVIRIGSMPTEDILPLWVAERDGFFVDENVRVEIQVFDSAPALSAAITAQQVDLAMTDIMRAVKLTESGTPLNLEWVTLGTDAAQGRFGVLAPADAPYNTLSELAAYVAENPVAEGEGVGVAANTVPEYSFDALCLEAGVEPGTIPTVEVASLPERFGLVASGKILAAALPNSLLTMGEAKGLKVIADDTQGGNISQSVMVALSSFAQDNENAIEAVAKAWDKAVEAINANPTVFKELLFEKANIKAELATIYQVSAYPMAMNGANLAHPLESIVEPYLTWMRAKGYGALDATYNSATGAIKAA